MKGRILSYTAVFFLLVLLFNQVSRFFEKVELKSLKYSRGEIEKFTISGVNSDRYILKGDKLVDTGEGYLIKGFNLEYIKNNEKLHIYSDEGIYKRKDDILDLNRNVKIVSSKLILETDFLRMLVKERRAFNGSPVRMYSDGMETYGDNLFIDIVKQSLKLENVKTVFRGR